MIKDTTFEKALAISVTLHIVILTPWPGFQSWKRKPYKSQKISPEIVVYNYKVKEENVFKVEEQRRKTSEPKKPPLDTSFQKEENGSSQVKDEKKTQDMTERVKVHPGPRRVEAKNVNVKKDNIVSLSGKLDTRTISQSVLNYYRAIREEIKKRAYYYKPQIQGNGVVTVLFTLSRDGVLRELAVEEASSTSQDVFRKAALKSIKYASPFPPFPSELKEDYITFSITIEFNLAGR